MFFLGLLRGLFKWRDRFPSWAQKWEVCSLLWFVRGIRKARKPVQGNKQGNPESKEKNKVLPKSKERKDQGTRGRVWAESEVWPGGWGQSVGWIVNSAGGGGRQLDDTYTFQFFSRRNLWGRCFVKGWFWRMCPRSGFWYRRSFFLCPRSGFWYRRSGFCTFVAVLGVQVTIETVSPEGPEIAKIQSREAI